MSDELTNAIMRLVRECTEHPMPLPKPSCPECARNGGIVAAACLVAQQLPVELDAERKRTRAPFLMLADEIDTDYYRLGWEWDEAAKCALGIEMKIRRIANAEERRPGRGTGQLSGATEGEA